MAQIISIGGLLVYDIRLGLLAGLLAVGAMLWRYGGPWFRAARVTVSSCAERLAMGGALRANTSGIDPARQTHLREQIIDQVLAQHPRLGKAQLAKAGILWHLYGDRHGARCYCLALLNQIQPDDPLMGPVCDLYTSTYNVSPTHPTPSAFQSAAEYGHLGSSTASEGIPAKVIPFKPGRLRSLSINS